MSERNSRAFVCAWHHHSLATFGRTQPVTFGGTGGENWQCGSDREEAGSDIRTLLPVLATNLLDDLLGTDIVAIGAEFEALQPALVSSEIRQKANCTALHHRPRPRRQACAQWQDGLRRFRRLAVTEISCMAHSRRKFFSLHTTNKSQIVEQALGGCHPHP